MSDDNTRRNDPDATRTSSDIPNTPLAQLPQAIGQYRILAKLGEGGMGVVYEAEQRHPKRTVAVKVVRGGQFIDERHVRMFQREADTLARLKHPNIASIYESNHTDDGQHFFAMELVRGETLHRYMNNRPPAVTRGELHFRLALFRKIADAVHYAHQRGVIHRDLKPSNVIVTEEAPRNDSNAIALGAHLPEIKILDFGLARITEGDLAAATMTTEVGVIKGTLPYMSPEQARGNPDDIDVRTDVYALGVILYEMLTGRRPYDVLKKSIVEAVRVICEESPRPMQVSLSGVRKLDPDVSTIVGKALEKETDRRYSNAAALSEDVARYLASQPILARPASTVYQLKKFVGRNRAFVGGLVATSIVLVAGTVVSTAGMVRATRAEEQARQEAATASQVSDFLVELFEVSDPGEARGNSVTAREILDRGVEKIEEELEGQPVVQERLMKTMGLVYRRLGLYQPATRLFESIATQRKQLLGDDHPDTLSARNDLAAMYRSESRYDEAESLYLATIESRIRVLGDDHPDSLSSKRALGILYKILGRYDEAEVLSLEAVEGNRRVLGEEHPSTLSAMNDLAILYWYQERYEAAEALHTAILETNRRKLGDEDPETVFAMSQLSKTYYRQGRYDKAVGLTEEVLEARRASQGPDDLGTLNSMQYVGVVYMKQGRLDEAETMFLEEIAGRERVQGDEHPQKLDAMTNLASVYMEQDRHDEAESLLIEILGTRRRLIGNEHQSTIGSIRNLAYCYRKQNRLDEAEELLRENIETARRVLGERHPRTIKAMTTLIELYQEQGRTEDARSLAQLKAALEE